jgi:hypothetical protein
MRVPSILHNFAIRGLGWVPMGKNLSKFKAKTSFYTILWFVLAGNRFPMELGDFEISLTLVIVRDF